MVAAPWFMSDELWKLVEPAPAEGRAELSLSGPQAVPNRRALRTRISLQPTAPATGRARHVPVIVRALRDQRPFTPVWPVARRTPSATQT
jgi:hypothetical protein